MAIRIPSLDDRTFEQLVDVLRRQIPPDEWTDHNPSDPGIVLLELLCWIGEMTLYRMDQVPASHRAKFLDFLIDPPEPVTVDVTFTVDFVDPTGSVEVTIKAGALLATDYVDGRRFVFETFSPLRLVRPGVGTEAEGTIPARAILEVADEPLGESDGTADQTFELRPPRGELGLDPDDPAPVLTDFVHRSDAYEPNPEVEVGGVEWRPVPSLRTEGSRVGQPDPPEHYMIDAAERRIRFGDGTFGVIPPEGAQITCTRYRILEGPAALTVRAGDLRHVLEIRFVDDADQDVDDVDLVSLANTDAEGGASFFPAGRRLELGLSEVRAHYRLVTRHDFERTVLEDFNAFQRLSHSGPEIVRASAVLNRRPPLSDDVEAPGYVTFVLLPGPPHFDDAVFRDESLPVAAKQAMVALPTGLWDRLARFLDRRRLITTRLRQQEPELKPLTVAGLVVVDGDRNLADMEQSLRRRILDFLSVLTGGFDGRGWRLGRNVFRSQLFRLLEDAEGVDHVRSLTLSPADADGNVVIGPHQLPIVQSVSLATVRA